MSGYLLDTVTISESVKPRPNAGVSNWLRTVDEAATYISVLTIGELQKGIARLARDTPKRAELERWLAFDLIARFGRRVLAFDTNVARHWGTMIASAADRGLALQAVDSQIAATAFVYGLKVVTRNARHFTPTGVGTLDPWTIP